MAASNILSLSSRANAIPSELLATQAGPLAPTAQLKALGYLQELPDLKSTSNSAPLVAYDLDNMHDNSDELISTKSVIVEFEGNGIFATAHPLSAAQPTRPLFVFRCEGPPRNRENCRLPKIFLAKPFRYQDELQNGLDNSNEDELLVYKRLNCLQGIFTPRCYGRITWWDVKGGSYTGIAIEFLDNFRRLETSDTTNETIYTNCRLAIKAISQEGILHGEIELRNILLEPNTKEIRIIDFEYSWIVTTECDRDGRDIEPQNLIDLDVVFKRI